MKFSDSTMLIRPDIDNLSQQHPYNFFLVSLSSSETTLAMFETKSIEEIFTIKFGHKQKNLLLLVLPLYSSEMYVYFFSVKSIIGTTRTHQEPGKTD